jgi:hypothetical protein
MENDSNRKYFVSGYEEFRQRATDSSLTGNQKTGFPDSLRQNKSAEILADIVQKMPCLETHGATFLDIGMGCSDLALDIIRLSEKQGHSLVAVDSEEMLRQLPPSRSLKCVYGAFPDCIDNIRTVLTQFNAILVYSVVQYIFASANIWSFVDHACSLLAPGGRLLIGDIPNASRRKRFLASQSGREFHRMHYDANTSPVTNFNQLDVGEIDDAVVLGIVARLRTGGYDAYLVPQSETLPMANRREDLLVVKPR